MFVLFACLKRSHKAQGGQVIVEYVLLLMLALLIAVIATRTLVSRGDQKGAIITVWQSLIVEIGRDTPDDLKVPVQR